MSKKYQNGKIYKIVDNASDMIYIGSTCKTLENRLKEHVSSYKSYLNNLFRFVSSFKILENGNYKIELIKLFNCENRKELERYEGNIIKKYRSNGLNIVNKNLVGQTRKETKACYREKNKEIINEKARQKYVCHCGSQYSKGQRPRHEKTIKHKTFINNVNKINRDDNVNTI